MNKIGKNIRHIMVAFVLIAVVSGLSSCEKYSYTPPTVDPSATLLFQTDIQPIFSKNCISCHGGTKSPDLRDGKSYKALSTGGYLTAPAESSRLFTTMSEGDHISRSSETDRLKVLYWITQGAKNN